MQFKLDENMPHDVVGLFLNSGHDVVTALQEGLGGRPDPNVYGVCLDERRALITLDLDFSDIRAYPPAGSPGIIVIRLARQDARSVLAALQNALPLMTREPLVGHLWIVEEARVRIRGEDETVIL